MYFNIDNRRSIAPRSQSIVGTLTPATCARKRDHHRPPRRRYRLPPLTSSPTDTSTTNHNTTTTTIYLYHLNTTTATNNTHWRRSVFSFTLSYDRFHLWPRKPPYSDQTTLPLTSLCPRLLLISLQARFSRQRSIFHSKRATRHHQDEVIPGSPQTPFSTHTAVCPNPTKRPCPRRRGEWFEYWCLPVSLGYDTLCSCESSTQRLQCNSRGTKSHTPRSTSRAGSPII